MNRQRVKNALFTLLNHPEQLYPGNAADLHLALWSDSEYEQGAVSELLRDAIDDLLRKVTD